MQAVLFLHGFTALKEDNEIFLNKISENKTIDLYAPILKGHLGKIEKLTYQDWINQVELEVEEILTKYQSITVIGHSMGGLIASSIASKHKEVTSLILIAPAFYFGGIDEWKQYLIDKVKGKESEFPFKGSFTKWRKYPNYYFKAFIDIIKALKDDVKEVTCPTLIVHGTRDPVVPFKASIYANQYIKGKTYFTRLKDIGHQVFKSNKKELIIEYLYHYLIDDFEYQEEI